MTKPLISDKLPTDYSIKLFDMARFCPLTGKKTSTGNNVSHSKRRTKRKFFPNLLKTRLVDPVTGQARKMRISAKALRTLKKHIKMQAA